MRVNAAHVWIVAYVLLTGRSSEASRDTECTSWRLDAPTPVADGGLESMQCTCLGWIQYGEPPVPRYACDLCAQVPGTGYGTCLRTGATLPPEGCSHASGASLLTPALVLLWLVSRGSRRGRLRITSNVPARPGQAARVQSRGA